MKIFKKLFPFEKESLDIDSNIIAVPVVVAIRIL